SLADERARFAERGGATTYEDGQAAVFAADDTASILSWVLTSTASAGSAEAKCFRLSFQRARAIIRGFIFRSCHHSRSFVVVCMSRWCIAQRGTVNSSLTFNPKPRGCA